MTDGVFDPQGRRYPSKKALKEAIASGQDPDLECTSLFGGAGGPFSELPDGNYTIVGPDPYTSRKWYGQLTISNGQARVK